MSSFNIIYSFICIEIGLILFSRRKSLNVNNLTEMYKRSQNEIFIHMDGGLGNRILSLVGIILLSVYFKAKPFSIIMLLY